MEERISERSYRVPEKFIVTSRGKQMVLYGGLLDAAHHQGLVSIDTELVQIPNTDNENVAIVKATATISSPDDAGHLVRTFSGIGDASPKNVGSQIVEHIIRMAETRAKARALRDAVDIGGLMINDDPASEVDYPASDTPPPTPTLPEVLASKQRQGYLKKLIDELGMENGRAQFELKHGPISNFTPEKAEHWIAHFKPIVEGEASDEDAEKESDD